VWFAVAATDETGRRFHNDTYTYYANIGGRPFRAGDDVARIVSLTLDQLHALASRYQELPPTLWHKGPEGSFSWADYAKMYGPIHQAVADALQHLPHRS
jgi:hypothetical protein